MAKWEVWVTGGSVNVRERIEEPGDYRVFQVCGGYNARGMALEIVRLGDLDVDAMRAALESRGGRLWEDRSETLVVALAKATIVSQGEFGMSYRVDHVRDLRVYLGKHAQYTAAVHASFVVKGCRKRVGFVQSYRPNLIVLEGWADVNVPSMWGDAKKGDGATTQTSRGLSCSGLWSDEARAAVAASGAKVVRDFREHDSAERMAA